jgi:hypothetical protein
MDARADLAGGTVKVRTGTGPDSSYPAAEEPAQPDDDSQDARGDSGLPPASSPVMPAVGVISPQGGDAAGTGSPRRADQATAPVTGGAGTTTTQAAPVPIPRGSPRCGGQGKQPQPFSGTPKIPLPRQNDGALPAEDAGRPSGCYPLKAAGCPCGDGSLSPRSNARTSDSRNLRCPPGVRILVIRPEAAQRVTVFGSTRNRAATSPGVSRRSLLPSTFSPLRLSPSYLRSVIPLVWR